MAGAFTQSPVGAYGGASGSAQLAGGLGQGGGGAALDSAAAAATSTSSASLGSRISDFVEKNKRGLLIGLGATVVVVGSAGAYYYYTKPTASRKKGKGADGEDSPSIGGVADDSGASGKRKSKKKKSKKSTGPATSTQERSSSPTVEEGDSEGSAADDPLKLTSAQIAALPEEKRKTIAAQLKTKGNKAYSARNFQEAIDIYTQAIACDEQAIFYSNRAACYTNLQKHEEVIRDCTEALRLDPGYVKALNRRGSSREQLGGEENLFQALCDFTAGAIIDGFSNDAMAKSVDRVMKQLAQEKGAKILKEREPRLPSSTFIKAYMEAFRPRPLPEKPENPSQGESTLFLAFDGMDARDYTHAFTLFNEALEQGISDSKLKARALNMRGTFKFIIGDSAGALKDLDESTTLDPKFTQTWVKKASVHMELCSTGQSDPAQAFGCFDSAIAIDDKDSDIYYHRGQVYFITGSFDQAIAEYKKSTELDPTFVFSQIQLAVAMYKNEQAERALHLFKRIIRDFGDKSPEVYNYYGEILLDRAEFTAALENLDKAISLEKERSRKDPRSTMNVLPMVNKALCLYQSRQALPEAEEICREALEIDPTCDIAVATLGQLLLQQNKVHEAVKAFEKSAEIARTEPELVNALAYENATKAQLDFIEKYPEYAHRMGLAQSRI
ncbi:ADP ATP carrier receptor [Cystobasidium minutum MCA 4210]|uniref:ADP ATP carrier receptor n=1 Tax=Cystobasidium minutum MCA 4210 TaxID=1397322 RepID=UPI0034CDFA67|eukprot:jgi/Rhomi1/148826/estExt_Genewise1.C_1_t20073